MSVTSNKHLYYSLRMCLVLLGLFLVTTSVLSFVFPTIFHSESAHSPLGDKILDFGLLVYGALLLTPFRWLKRAYVFQVTLLVFTIGILWSVYTSFASIIGLLQGRQSLLILPVSATFFLLVLMAPGALLMRRRLDV